MDNSITIEKDLIKLSISAGADDKGGLTKAGRALQKHGSRLGSSFLQAKGNPSDINRQAQNIVDNILNNPDSKITRRHHPRFGDIIEIKSSDGHGIRYDGYGNFIGFLEP